MTANLLLIHTFSFAQEQVSGKVEDINHKPLVGATVQILGTTEGTVTNTDGIFSILIEKDDKLVLSFVGYQNDTIAPVFGQTKHYKLIESNIQLGDIVVEAESSSLDEFDAKHTELILESELLKAACCNLSESFETNASVDVSFSDAVSGAKVIRLLGLDGRYVQINRENIPLVRGLSGRYGLGFIPGTWIQSIDLGKGAGTVVNGYESMVGQINLEFKKPENSEKLYVNAYANSFGRFELNTNFATDLNEKWSTVLLAHGDYFDFELDRNDDGFMDLPRSRQINIFNKYKYQGDKFVSQIGYNVLRDEKAGGQNGFDFGSDHLSSEFYGFSNNTTRIEVFGKTGLLFPHKPYKGWGLIYSGSYQKIESGFGRRLYEGEETTFYGNLIFQNIIGNSFHQYKTGASILYDDFDEVFQNSSFNRQEIVPGAYFEYSYLPGEQFSLTAGSRVDYHNLFGTYFTPRIHARYQIKPGVNVRLSGGRGYRTPNAITENIPFLISSREFIVQEELEPEVSWNTGGSLATFVKIGQKKVNLVFDYFYTYFENQMVVDQDASSDAIFISNLNGDSYAHSFQLESSYDITERLKAKAAYKYYDVRTTLAGELRRVPYISRDRLFFNLEYATKFEKWKADATVQWFGRKRLPNTSDKPEIFQQDGFSPDFVLVNAQISRGFRWGNIYLGSENLLNFKQDNPIIDAENPFGENFDASIVWGPVPGRLVYVGLRYKIKRQ